MASIPHNARNIINRAKIEKRIVCVRKTSKNPFSFEAANLVILSQTLSFESPG